MEVKNWDSYFEGREEQLSWLKQQWQEAKQGRPKLVTILGESGLGKTRLVQELYAHLSKDQAEDPNGYWPPHLDAGRNLAYNPPRSDVNTDVDIPWLWWGMRFAIPSERNQVVVRSPFVAEDPNLAIHAIPIVRMRKRKHAQWEAAKTLSTLIADFFSFSIYGQASSIMGMLQNRVDDMENKDKSAAQILAEQVEEVVKQTLATLCMFLKPTETDAPTVPVIMLVDDAQWMDPVTLQAINTIMAMALEEKWPLLIVCTHWQKEWNHYPGLDIYQHPAFPENLKQLVDMLNHRDSNSALTLPLNKLHEQKLAPVVDAALPGIDKAHKDYLIKEADGNPRVLEEMIRLLLYKPDVYFEGGDTKAALTRKGENRLSKLTATDIYKLVADRFDELDVPLQDILSTGALIGPEFLKPLVVDMLIASEESTPESLANISMLARQAQDLHALIQAKSKETDVFQQKLYQTVALNYLKEEDEDRYNALMDVQIDVYQQWLHPEKYQQLDSAEQYQLFELILEFACTTDNHEISPESLAHAFDKLYHHYDTNNLQSLVATWWKCLLQQPPHWLTAFALNLQTSKYGLFTLLEYDTNQLDSILRFEESLMTQLQSIESVPLHQIAWHGIFGKIYSEYDSVFEKKVSFHFQQECKKLANWLSGGDYSEDLIRAFSNSLINMAYWIDRVGCDECFIDFDYDDPFDTRSRIEETRRHESSMQSIRFGGCEVNKTPDYLYTTLALCSESLFLSQLISDTLGESPERLMYIAANHNCVADFTVKTLRPVDIFESNHTEPLQFNRGFDSRFGDIPELFEFSDAVDWVVEIAQGDETYVDKAEYHYAASLQVRRDIITRFGETPERLRDISVSLDRAADFALQARGDQATAEAHFAESLQICRNIVERFGESPERLRDISVSLGKVANYARYESDDISTAEACYIESLAIRRYIVNLFGENPKRLRDISVSLNNVADLALRACHHLAAAETQYTESLGIRRGIVTKYGESPERLRDICVSYFKMALVNQNTENIQAKVEWLLKARALLAHSIKQYGMTHQTEKDQASLNEALEEVGVTVP